jgi:hypothetical protein
LSPVSRIAFSLGVLAAPYPADNPNPTAPAGGTVCGAALPPPVAELDELDDAAAEELPVALADGVGEADPAEAVSALADVTVHPENAELEMLTRASLRWLLLPR